MCKSALLTILQLNSPPNGTEKGPFNILLYQTWRNPRKTKTLNLPGSGFGFGVIKLLQQFVYYSPQKKWTKLLLTDRELHQIWHLRIKQIFVVELVRRSKYEQSVVLQLEFLTSSSSSSSAASETEKKSQSTTIQQKKGSVNDPNSS